MRCKDVVKQRRCALPADNDNDNDDSVQSRNSRLRKLHRWQISRRWGRSGGVAAQREVHVLFAAQQGGFFRVFEPAAVSAELEQPFRQGSNFRGGVGNESARNLG